MDEIKIVKVGRQTKTQKIKQMLCEHEHLETYCECNLEWHINGIICVDCWKILKLNISARKERIYS